MNTASLENCKKLYELSKWGDYYNDVAMEYFWDKDELKQKTMSITSLKDFVSAYDLGYLLRKLPAEVALTKFIDSNGVERYQVNHHTPNKLFNLITDTPEDAAALLAVALFNQGILTKEPS